MSKPKKGESKKSSKVKSAGRPHGDPRESKEIISVTINQAIKKQIDDLVDEGVARSRAQLIEDAVTKYLELNVDKWTDRGIYFNDVRVLLAYETISSVFFSTLTPDQQYELGSTAGRQAPEADIILIKHRKNPKKLESRKAILNLLQETGWGEIKLDNDLIVIGSPFYPGPFIRGYLEELMNVQLEIVETNVKETVVLRIAD